MVKSPKIAKIPEVLVSFLESINFIPPNQNLLNIFFFLFYAIFFQKKINQIWLPFYRFLFLRKKKHKKRKTKFGIRFIVFPFTYKQTQKTKNKIQLPFYCFSFYVQTNTKNKKTKNDFRFIVFPFMYEKTQKRKNKNRLLFYRFSFYLQTNT